MKKNHFLKVLRVLLAILFFAPILAFFLDFAGLLPDKMHALMQIQLLPAILGGIYVVVGVLLLLTLLFGRIYCSVICPAGVLQDVINRIFCIRRKKPKGVYRFRHHKPSNLLRYGLLIITAALAVIGFSELCLLLDPYSNFGRIAANLFSPVAIWINNLLASLLNGMGNYTLYHVTISTVTTSSLVAASIAMALFIVLTVWRGRLFCNSLCPVGALLSLISRYSIFRIFINQNACNHCHTCERACKAEAINSETMTVDMSRCVDCFNCLSTCKRNAIKYKPFFIREMASAPDETKTALKGRREFIATSAAIAVATPAVLLAQGNHDEENNGKRLPVTPPGSRNLERFKDKCTACHLCVTRCPSHVLRPTALEYGFGYMLKPRMAYINSFCNFECTICSEVCPTGAIMPISTEEKKTTQIGIAHFDDSLCVVSVKDQDCGACSEHCPTQAVHMVPYKGTLTIPKVENELCVGCGGCESICPVRPERAIVVRANPEHKQAEKPKDEEPVKVDVNDFGF